MLTASIQKAACLLCFILLGIQMQAQNIRYHTVGKGETMASIAYMYGTSEAEIKKANPIADKVFYAGLRLVIPEAGKAEPQTVQSVQAAQPDPQAKPKHVESVIGKSETWTYQLTPSADTAVVRKEERKTFPPTLSVGLFLGNDCSEVTGSAYGLAVSYHNESGWGAYMSLATNMAVKPDSETDFIIKAGPGYRYKPSEDTFLGASLCFSLTSASYDSRSALISGLSLMPCIGWSFDNVELYLSVDAYVRNGHSGVRVGPYFGISYSFKN